MVDENDTAPDFELRADDGSTVRLSDLRGHKVLLYFYPKDDTPGCTRQACDLRDRFDEIEARDLVVLGISPDPVDSHVKFRDKYSLPFRLLADTEHEVAEAYGVWKRKSMFGKKFWGIERGSFLIDEDGRVEKAWRKVGAKQHIDLLLEAVSA